MNGSIGNWCGGERRDWVSADKPWNFCGREVLGG